MSLANGASPRRIPWLTVLESDHTPDRSPNASAVNAKNRCNARIPFIVASLAACMSVSVSAQSATTAPVNTGAMNTTTATPSTAYRGLRASAIIGKEVRNPQGINIGKINELIVDMNTGDVRYAILEFDPGVFQGERLFAVPTNQLRMAADREELVYNMTRGRLERTAVNRADWKRTWRDPNYLADLDKTWGVVQPSRRSGSPTARRRWRSIRRARREPIETDAATVASCESSPTLSAT